ncbi:hypothetical protein ACFU6S_27405 [Streptomyces sp. NPDC057456]|uniref:hypothetical protein n=1 Tax=Streptomyces sp. NPDC057456 TaxID=3346139 RepID=UPI0036A98437
MRELYGTRPLDDPTDTGVGVVLRMAGEQHLAGRTRTECSSIRRASSRDCPGGLRGAELPNCRTAELLKWLASFPDVAPWT